MPRFQPILTKDEIAQLTAMSDRIRDTRPDQRGPQMKVHFAVEDAVSGLIAIGQGNPSCANDFTEIGKNIRQAVLDA